MLSLTGNLVVISWNAVIDRKLSRNLLFMAVEITLTHQHISWLSLCDSARQFSLCHFDSKNTTNLIFWSTMGAFLGSGKRSVWPAFQKGNNTVHNEWTYGEECWGNTWVHNDNYVVIAQLWSIDTFATPFFALPLILKWRQWSTTKHIIQYFH